jgi:hypothetical protein
MLLSLSLGFSSDFGCASCRARLMSRSSAVADPEFDYRLKEPKDFIRVVVRTLDPGVSNAISWNIIVDLMEVNGKLWVDDAKPQTLLLAYMTFDREISESMSTNQVVAYAYNL